MFRPLFENKQLRLMLIQQLQKYNSDISWNNKLSFAYNKYYDENDKQFDIDVLYLIVYALRGHIHAHDNAYQNILQLVHKNILTNQSSTNCKIYVHMIHPSKIDEYAIKYGQRLILKIMYYTECLQHVLENLLINYSVVYDYKSISNTKNSILFYCAGVLPCYEEINIKNYASVITVIPMTCGDSLINIFILNLLNCCFTDTITDTNNKYNIINYNILSC